MRSSTRTGALVHDQAVGNRLGQTLLELAEGTGDIAVVGIEKLLSSVELFLSSRT